MPSLSVDLARSLGDVDKPQRLKWSNEDMEAAMKAVSDEKMTAARTFNVPRKTLDERTKGHVKHGSKPGVSTVLTAAKEESLTQYLLYMMDCGFPLTRTMVKAFVSAIAKRSGKSNRCNKELGPSDHRWQLFKQRHPAA